MSAFAEFPKIKSLPVDAARTRLFALPIPIPACLPPLEYLSFTTALLLHDLKGAVAPSV
jgi:hypothetical protein